MRPYEVDVRVLTFLLFAACAAKDPDDTEPVSDTDADSDSDTDADADTDTDADSDSDTDTDAGTTDTGVPAPDCDTDTDGDGVPDEAELAITYTDPAISDGGCLAWTPTVVRFEQWFYSTRLALGDLDGDGDADALGGDDDSTLFWYENLGAGAFGPRVWLWDQEVWSSYYGDWIMIPATAVAIADLEGDGLADALFASDGVQEVRSLGGGLFADGQTRGAALYDQDLAVADLDGDGDVDVAGARDFHEVAWFENVGAGKMVSHAIEIRDWVDLEPGDLDGDGDVDLAFVDTYWYGDVGWYENTGAAFVPHVLGSFAEYGESLAVGDLDGDGDLELAASGTDTSFGSWSLRWWDNLGGGVFSAANVLDTASGVEAHDLDGDGDAELVGIEGGALVWWLREGGGFVPRPIGGLPEAVTFADLDGDGATDIGTLPGFSWYRNPLRDDSDADGLTDEAERCVLGTDPALADSDGDGFDDHAEVCALRSPTDASVHP